MRVLDRCPLCPTRNLPADQRKFVVPGDGSLAAKVMFVAEAPGKEENNRHRPFVGKTGDEFNNTYLPRCSMTRDNIYLTNTVKCHWADSSDAPPEDVIKSCADFHLRREIAEVQPDLIVLMGGVANGLVDWDVDMEHGIWHDDVELYGFRGPIYSTFHPALGMHMSSKMQALLDDFRLLRDYLLGDKEPPRNRYPDPYLARVRTPQEVDDTLYGAWEDHPIAIDTESIKRWLGYRSTITYDPWCLTYCAVPGGAYMIRREDEAAMKHFNYLLSKFRRIYMHNYPHDDWQLRQMGVVANILRVYDTMSGAYHDARLARGLKSLSWRLLGMRMTSFDEIVRPHGVTLALEYLADAALIKWPEPAQIPTGAMVERNCKECKGTGKYSYGTGKSRKTFKCECGTGKVMVPAMTRNWSLNQLIDRTLGSYRKTGKIDPWLAWENWEERVQPMIDRLGPIPVASIDQVPEDQAIIYACGDALGTRLLGPIMERRVAAIRRMVRDA